MSATDELSRMLDERGKEHRVWPSGLVIWHDEGSWVYEYSPPKGDDDYWGGILHATLRHCTPEQAVEATLGETPTPPPPTPPKQPPYDLLIDLLRDEWDIEASWDGLRRFWYVGLTDEGVRKRDEREATLGRGTMTADDVRDLIERHSDACGCNGRDFHNGAYVAIADELNATLGSCNCSNSERTETCELTDNGPWGYPYVCSACGASFDADVNGGDFNFCPNCGAEVVDE